MEPADILPVDGTLTIARTVRSGNASPGSNAAGDPAAPPGPDWSAAHRVAGRSQAMRLPWTTPRSSPALIDRTIRQIQVFFNPGGVHDPTYPPNTASLLRLTPAERLA